jgi:hypothetical protein
MIASPRRVVAKFLQQAAQPPGARSDAKKMTHPINKPKGIRKDIVDDHASRLNHREDTVEPGRRDIRPEDVFAGTPNQMGVLNLAQTGKDLSKAMNQIKKDKGYDSVSNLSQYLISTEGGGGTPPAGIRK